MYSVLDKLKLHSFLIFLEQSTRVSSFFDRSTMSAKSLGTLPVICAIDVVQNHLPLKTMLFIRDMTSIIGKSDTFLLIQHCIRGGKGVYILVNASETGRG